MSNTLGLEYPEDTCRGLKLFLAAIVWNPSESMGLFPSSIVLAPGCGLADEQGEKQGFLGFLHGERG